MWRGPEIWRKQASECLLGGGFEVRGLAGLEFRGQGLESFGVQGSRVTLIRLPSKVGGHSAAGKRDFCSTEKVTTPEPSYWFRI